jgi:hypothetical protein
VTQFLASRLENRQASKTLTFHFDPSSFAQVSPWVLDGVFSSGCWGWDRLISVLAQAATCVETFPLRVHEAQRGFSDKLLSGLETMISFPWLESRETSAPNLPIGFVTPSAAHGRTPFPQLGLGSKLIIGD